MGGTVTKSGVAVDGKAAAEPANGKANGQVSASDQTRPAGTGRRIRQQTAPRQHGRPGWETSGREPGPSSRAGLQPRTKFYTK